MQAIAKNTGEVSSSMSTANGHLKNLVSSNNVIATGVSILAVYVVADGCHRAYRYFRPADEEKLRRKNAAERLAVMDATRKLNDCLVTNADAKKNEEGLPCHCDGIAEMFARVAGYSALNEIKESFRKRSIICHD